MGIIRQFAGGRTDLQGKKVNTLRVGDYISRTPLRWRTVCEQCGAEGSDTHERLVSGFAACRAQSCGKSALRSDLEDTPSKYQRRIEATEARERDAAEEAQAAKIADLKSSFEDTNRQIALTIRERILTQRDDELYVDPATVGISMNIAEAATQNGEQSALFIRENRDYYPSAKNWDTLRGYFERNGINILSVPTIAAAVKRLDSYGLLERRPAPTPEPAPRASSVNLTVESEPEPQQQPTGPETFIGFDHTTGLQREFTAREVDRMGADEYRRTFRIYRSALGLPNVGPR